MLHVLVECLATRAFLLSLPDQNSSGCVRGPGHQGGGCLPLLVLGRELQRFHCGASHLASILLKRAHAVPLPRQARGSGKHGVAGEVGANRRVQILAVEVVVLREQLMLPHHAQVHQPLLVYHAERLQHRNDEGVECEDNGPTGIQQLVANLHGAHRWHTA